MNGTLPGGGGGEEEETKNHQIMTNIISLTLFLVGFFFDLGGGRFPGDLGGKGGGKKMISVLVLFIFIVEQDENHSFSSSFVKYIVPGPPPF